jgi:hypothetical protein
MFVDDSGDVKIIMRVDAANDRARYNLLNIHTGSPRQTLDRRFTETGCLDRTVTRQKVRPLLGHLQR